MGFSRLPRRLLYLCFVVQTVILVTTLLYKINSCDNGFSDEILVLQKQLDFYKRQQIRSVLDTNTGITKSREKIHSDDVIQRRIPESRKLGREYQTNDTSLKEYIASVTVLIYDEFETPECLVYQIGEIRKVLGNILIVISSAESFDLQMANDSNLKIIRGKYLEGNALNMMMSCVNTDYFLYISRGAVPTDFSSHNGPGWLLHALKSIPELDFIGGAYVWYNSSLQYQKYEIQCYRMRMCDFVFSQSYEYKYSVGDMMVCEETSTSFMGRTSSIEKVGGFDPNLEAMATTDFFWRAKADANVGLRPEVYFNVTKTCSRHRLSPQKQSRAAKSFMDKHDLRIIQDSYGRKTLYPKGFRFIGGFNGQVGGGVMTPTQYDHFKDMLFLGDDFFKSNNITYIVESGSALGALKMRRLIPWDHYMDVDTLYYGMSQEEMEKRYLRLCPGCSFSSGNPPSMRHCTQPDGEGVFGEYTALSSPTPPPYQFLYVYINGRDIPVRRDFVTNFRDGYGLDYLITRNRYGHIAKCSRSGHHACLPKAFVAGGGHWLDFYCHV